MWSIMFAPPTWYATVPGAIVRGARKIAAVQTRFKTRTAKRGRLHVSRDHRGPAIVPGKEGPREKPLREKGKGPPGHFAYRAGFLSKAVLQPPEQK